MKSNGVKFNTKVIYDFLKINDLSKAEFCRKYNFSLNTLNSLLKNKAGVRPYRVVLLIKILNITMDEFLFLNLNKKD